MTTAHHGTHHETLPLHAGVCFALGGHDDGFLAASEYARVHGGEWVHEVEIALDGLTVRHLEIDVRACRDADHFPCDSAREIAAFIAEGVDAVAYDDACHTLAHRTIRLLSARALAAVTYVAGYDPA